MTTNWSDPTDRQREVLCELVRTFGLTPEDVTIDGVRLVKIPMLPYVECTVFKRDEDGNKYLTGANELATSKRRFSLHRFTPKQHAILNRVHAAFKITETELAP